MRVIITTIIATLASTISAFAGATVVNPVNPIPTLSEWGLITMVGALGIIGAIVLRRRLASKVG